MSKPITRQEMLLNSIANDQNSNLSPITREEQYLSYIAGETNSFPTKPITRKEALLDKIAKNGIAGGSGLPDGYIKPEGTKEITENGEYDVTTYAKVNVDVATSGGGGDGEEFTADRYFEGGHEDIVLPNATSLRSYAIYNDATVKNIVMPKVTSIGDYAINNCSKLELVQMPKVTSIGNYAFRYCVVLGLTELPIGLTTIGTEGFGYCYELALTSLPSALNKIGEKAFHYCQKIAINEIPSGVNNIGTRAFSNCKALTSITFKGTPTGIIQPSAFADCPNLKTINVPWAEGEVLGAPWGATNATINYNYGG